MDRQTQATLALSISNSGQHLKRWIYVLDDLAEAQILAHRMGIDETSDAYTIHKITLNLALSITHAYAQAFSELIDHAIALDLPGMKSQLETVAQHRGLITDPQSIFRQMCEAKRAAVSNQEMLS